VKNTKSSDSYICVLSTTLEKGNPKKGIIFLFHFNPLPPSDADRKQEKDILEHVFSSALFQYKNIKISHLWKPKIYRFRHF